MEKNTKEGIIFCGHCDCHSEWK